MSDNITLKLSWLSVPAVQLSQSAQLLATNKAFDNLADNGKSALLQQLRLIIDNSDLCGSGYKNVHISLGPQTHYATNITLQAAKPQTFAAIFYPLQQSSTQTELYASVFAHSGEAIMITDVDDDIVAVNQSFVETTGFSANEVMYRKPDFLRRGLNEENTLQHAWQNVAKHDHWSGEIKNRKANGEYYVCWLSLSAVRDDAGLVSHYVSIFSDITRHITEHKKFKKLAHYDFLTGLPNRALLEDRFEQFVVQRHQGQFNCACIFIDVNDFKAINDNYGHKKGDECLIAIAKTLTAAIRQDDTACRFSGDEFVILLHDVKEPEDISRVTRQVQQQVAEIPAKLKFEKALSVSFGISLYPQDATDFDSLIDTADKAMYQDKRRYKTTS